MPEAREDRVAILHLSDLHFGVGEKEDTDWKVDVDGAERERRRDRLVQLLGELPRRPDFVVVSGDFTIAGRKNGFAQFLETLTTLIQRDKLPAVDRFIVVPGNHDVLRQEPGEKFDPKARWANFLEVGSRFVRPWLPECDPDLDTMKGLVEESCAAVQAMWGGSRSVQNPRTGDHAYLSVPFVFDRDRSILFYAFNSATISGSRVKLPEQVLRAIQWLRDWKHEDTEKVSVILRELELQTQVDPARIDPREFELFNAVVNRLRDHLNSEYRHVFKVAVLHHHVSPMLQEEVKSFELLLNAGRFKLELQQAGFHLILHGHKHAPLVFRDAAEPGNIPPWVVSGGTIGGGEAPGFEPGFYWLELDQAAARLDTRYVELLPGNPRDAFESARTIACDLPTIGGAAAGSGSIPGFPDLPRFDLLALFEDAAASLSKHLRRNPGSGGEEILGWSHHLDEEHVTAIATAYGLRILRLCETAHPNLRTLADRLCRSLLALRHSDGCWSASYETGVGRPEATSWVLLAFWDLARGEILEKAMDAYERILKTDRDPVLRTSVFSMALAVQTLATIRPESPLLAELASSLEEAAVTDGSGRPVFWGRRLGMGREGRSELEPSTIHSAHAALALVVAHRATAGSSGLPPESLGAVRDMLLRSNWSHTTEDITRPRKGGLDKLVVKHYTRAWAVRSLLRLGIDPAQPRIVSEIRKILEDRQDGVWRWSQVPKPIWATHDALETLREWLWLLWRPTDRP